MLFHITHRHSETNCPFHDREVLGETFAKMLGSFEDAGVTVHGSYVNAAAHVVYLVVESDSAEAIQAGLDPIIDMGTAVTEPVVESAAVVKDRMGE